MIRPILLADDLTGALDAGAAFAPLTVDLDLPTELVDAGYVVPVRERTAGEARAAMTRAAAGLDPSRPVLFKIDSLLRGPWATGLAALLATGRFRSCVLAPAFPGQGRITREARQWQVRPDGSLEPVAVDPLAALAAVGVRAASWPRGGALPEAQVTLADAVSDADLAAVVQRARALPGPLLWSGTAGLARALGATPPRAPASVRPLLVVVGTAHPTTAAQVEAVRRLTPASFVTVGTDGAMETAVATRLADDGLAVLTFPVAAGDPAHAARLIAARLRTVLPRLPRPATLLVTGGETLLTVARVLGARALHVTAEFAPGVPRSTLVGGSWDGVAVLSKSGAFGGPDLLAELITTSSALERF